MRIRRERRSESTPSRWATMRTDGERRLEEMRARQGVVDFGMRIYERDRDMDGSVVASAVALRVFLFFIPLLLILVASLGFVAGHLSAADATRQAGVSGVLAKQINAALTQSHRTRWIALFTGVFGAMWAGRTLARVLAAASRRAWGLSSRQVRVSYVRLTGSVAGMIAAVGALAIIVNRVRESTGPVGGSATTLTAIAVYSVAWLIVSLALPRGRSDRSVLLPGALFAGASLAVLQWVLQFEVQGKLSRASEVYGTIGTAVVTLGWFFFVGRIFVFSFAIDAVVWERFGSITTWLLSWKRLRRTVERHPRLERFLTAGSDEADEIATPLGEARPPPLA
jgi:membrane protein